MARNPRRRVRGKSVVPGVGDDDVGKVSAYEETVES